MAEFNWTVDDIKRAQRDFSNNFMRLDCIRIESYDVAIDCMTECIEKKAADVQPVMCGKWNGYLCSKCNEYADYFISGNFYFDEKPNFCPNCGARMNVSRWCTL